MKPKTIKVKIVNLILFTLFFSSCTYKSKNKIYDDLNAKFTFYKNDLNFSKHTFINLSINNNVFIVSIQPKNPNNLYIDAFLSEKKWTSIDTKNLIEDDLKNKLVEIFIKNLKIYSIIIEKDNRITYKVNSYWNYRGNQVKIIYCLNDKCNESFISNTCKLVENKNELESISYKDCWAYKLEDGWYIYSE